MGEHTETLWELLAYRGELENEIEERRDNLSRFMLVTGGASDVSDRMQACIDHEAGALAKLNERIDAMFAEMEALAFGFAQ